MSQHSEIRGSAEFSPDSRFRYELTREWDDRLPRCCFIGLNPSTADASVNDPTIRRCMGFARAWGYGSLLMLNLYAFRTPSPKALFEARKNCVDIIGGPSNYFGIMRSRIKNHQVKLTIAAWGKDGKSRGEDALCHIEGLHYLALNSDKTPKHPLYLKAELVPISFGGAEGR